MTDVFDYALVGGGLQNGLIALAVRAQQPTARIALIERGAVVGGNHTWCFHARDVPARAAAWVEPIVTARWPGYEVAFPSHARRLDTPYACVTSERLAEAVAHALGEDDLLLTGATAREVTADRVVLEDGRAVRARAVIDARGPERMAAAGGWQKFVGQELRVPAHGLERPILMDAQVPQRDGYRFFYVLPLADDRLLVEDTYFSDTPTLDDEHVRAEIAAYVSARGWRAEVIREERGVLPMPFATPAPSPAAPLIAGYAGGWFHPVTAYSFPIAARLADHVASRPADALFGPALDELARAQARQLRFCDRLNRMMFRWFAPDQRHHVLARFYRLAPSVIERFYALELTAFDRARILFGRPPRGLSLRAALGGSP